MGTKMDGGISLLLAAVLLIQKSFKVPAAQKP